MTDAPVPLEEHVPTADQFVLMRGDWQMYRTLLALRGAENSRPRMAYLDGVLELMSTSKAHEGIKSTIGDLVAAYCQEMGVTYSGFGEFTHEDETEEAGVEPDECYIFGRDHLDQARADLAIEVVWTRGGLRKLEIYRRLRIKEVWIWERGAITVFVLGADGTYAPAEHSIALPGIDLGLLGRLATVLPTSDAIREFREAVRAQARGS